MSFPPEQGPPAWTEALSGNSERGAPDAGAEDFLGALFAEFAATQVAKAAGAAKAGPPHGITAADYDAPVEEDASTTGSTVGVPWSLLGTDEFDEWWLTQQAHAATPQDHMVSGSDQVPQVQAPFTLDVDTQTASESTPRAVQSLREQGQNPELSRKGLPRFSARFQDPVLREKFSRVHRGKRSAEGTARRRALLLDMALSGKNIPAYAAGTGHKKDSSYLTERTLRRWLLSSEETGFEAAAHVRLANLIKSAANAEADDIRWAQELLTRACAKVRDFGRGTEATIRLQAELSLVAVPDWPGPRGRYADLASIPVPRVRPAARDERLARQRALMLDFLLAGISARSYAENSGGNVSHGLLSGTDKRWFDPQNNFGFGAEHGRLFNLYKKRLTSGLTAEDVTWAQQQLRAECDFLITRGHNGIFPLQAQCSRDAVPDWRYHAGDALPAATTAPPLAPQLSYAAAVTLPTTTLPGRNIAGETLDTYTAASTSPMAVSHMVSSRNRS